jgi:hypothetical protein
VKAVTNVIVTALLFLLLPFIALGVLVFALVAIWGRGKKAEAGKAQGEGPTIAVTDATPDMFGVN